MVISKLNLNRIEEGLDTIGTFLEKLRRLSLIPEEEFLTDERNPGAAESFMRRCLENIFDIGRHILAKSFGFRSLEYKEIAKELGDKGVVSKEYAITLIKMAGYRNRMVHFYKEVTNEELYKILQQDLQDIEGFLKEMAIFLEGLPMQQEF